MIIENSLDHKHAEIAFQYELNEKNGVGHFLLYLNPGYIQRSLAFLLTDDHMLADTYSLADGLYKWGFHVGIFIYQSWNDKKALFKNIDGIMDRLKNSLDEYFINKDRIVLFGCADKTGFLLEMTRPEYVSFFTGVVIHLTDKSVVFTNGGCFKYNYICAIPETSVTAITYCKYVYLQKHRYEIHVYKDAGDMEMPGSKNSNPGWWNSLNLWFNAGNWC
jgi:hypothetical protein